MAKVTGAICECNNSSQIIYVCATSPSLLFTEPFRISVKYQRLQRIAFISVYCTRNDNKLYIIHGLCPNVLN